MDSIPRKHTLDNSYSNQLRPPTTGGAVISGGARPQTRAYQPNDGLDFTLDDIVELNPDPRNDTDKFFSILHPPGYHRFTQDLAADWPKSYWSRSDEPLRMPPATGKEQIFVSINPICQRITDADRTNPKFSGKAESWIEQRIASKNRTVAALTALIRDYDAKDFTDPSQAEIIAQYELLRANPDKTKSTDAALLNEATGAAKSAKYKTDPARYKALALAHVKTLTPQPSVIVASGGGFNCFWLLAEPFHIRSHEYDHSNHITTYIADIQKRWVHMDARADQGVNDIRRILRPVGTINHKAAYAPNYPAVSFVKADFDLRYSLAELVAVLPAVKTKAPHATTRTATAAQKPTQATTEAQDGEQAAYAGNSVIHAYNAKHKIQQVLLDAGYTEHGDRMMRPGGEGQPGVELDIENNRSRHWSSNDALCDPHWRSPFDAFRVYKHDGNLSAAVYAAAVELDMVRTSEENEQLHQKQAATVMQWIQAATTWLQSADFAALIPVELQSATGYRTLATDKRLYSAFCDVLTGPGYSGLRGPVSIQQLSLASGLSNGSVRNALRRLRDAGLLRKIDAPNGTATGGAFWFELVIISSIISCVPCAALDVVTAKLPRARYATDTFTIHKVDDPYQRGGTKAQRKQATVKAIGPDGLIVIDAIATYGRMSHQQIGAITKQGKFTISRIIHRLEEFGVVTVDKEWRERFITLAPDWQVIVKHLAPSMPTYGNKFRRHLNAHLNTVEYCDRQTARGIGDKTRIEKQRERAAKAAFAIQAQELAENFTTERQAEALQQLRRHDVMKRVTAGVLKTVRTLPLIEVIARKQPAKWFEPFSQEDNRRLVAIMQTFDDNATLIEARKQMRDEDAAQWVTMPGPDWQNNNQPTFQTEVFA